MGDEETKDTPSENVSEKPPASVPTSTNQSKAGSAKSKASSPSKSPTPKSATGKRPPSKSPPPKSPQSPSRSSKPASGRQSAASKGSSKKEKDKKKTPDVKLQPDISTEQSEVEDRPLPDGCVPIFLSGPTQSIFGIRADEDVTVKSPNKLIPKEEILQDFHNRAGVSDFIELKELIRNYPGEELLVIYDADFKHGQNFVLATTEEAKEAVLKGPEIEAEEEPEPEEIYHYVPPEPKEWISLGSEKEIIEERVVETRPRIQVVFERIRREFGAPATFKDRDPGAVKDGYVEVTAYEDKSFGVTVMEMDKTVHNTPVQSTVATQSEWKYPVNAHTQYEPRELPEEEKQTILESEELQESAKNTLPLFVGSLQQNEIMDFFYDDYANLAVGDDTFDSRVDNTLKEFQSFTDLKFSKEKAVTCVQWHPTLKGIIAMSVAERMSFDERVDNAAKVIMSPSLIIVWSFIDPIQPQLLLEAPDDIYCFQFCPTDPHIVAGGCINGQVVLWDIEKHMDDLKNIKARMKAKNTMPYLSDFNDENALKVPIMRFCAVSSIEHSHVSPITDLLWVPDHFDVNRMGYPMENKTQKATQLITCATDTVINFWDTHAPKGSHVPDKRDAHMPPMGVPDTFKHLDLKWKPYLKVNLFKSEPGGDHAPTVFSIQELQGDRSVLEMTQDEKDKEAATAKLPGLPTKPGSAKARTLQNVNTHIYVGTEDGELVYVDWMPQKDQDTGKIQTTKPDFYSTIHDGPISAIRRSPFDKKVLLVVGGWMWSIWREGFNSGPILSSCAAAKPLTGGEWSPTRPAVFYVIRSDGAVEVWDLLDKTHEASLVQSISSAALTSIRPYNMAKQQLIAFGDTNGTLHVFEVRGRLRTPTPNEPSNLASYLEREVRRCEFVIKRWNFREQEKIEKEQELKRKAGIAPQVIFTDEEVILRMKTEYDQFLEEEQAFLRELGLKDDDDEPLPKTE